MADSTSTWRAVYNFGGGVSPTFSYPIASSEDWQVGSVLAWNSSGALLDPSADNADVLGISRDIVVSGAATGPVTDRCGVIPFNYGTVYAVEEVAAAGTPLAADIGELRDLDLASTIWGILNTTSGDSATPHFRVVDIDTIRNEWHVVIAPLEVPDVFQWLDAAV